MARDAYQRFVAFQKAMKGAKIGRVKPATSYATEPKPQPTVSPVPVLRPDPAVPPAPAEILSQVQPVRPGRVQPTADPTENPLLNTISFDWEPHVLAAR